MTFRRDVDLDPGQVSDRRGGGGVRRGGLAVGGGLGGLILVAAIVLLTGGNLGDILGGGSGLTGAPPEGPVSDELNQECETGADANERLDCRIVGTVNSVQAYWTDAFSGAGEEYQRATTVIFDGAVDTQCGSATSAVGPFYCPLNQTIYIDLGFYDQLESRFGAEGGPFAEMYVIAHEYGHHVQNLLGLLDAGRDAGAEGGAVRVELQADCFAGVWAANAVETGYLEPLTRDQINQALDAASAIGDDRIQEQTQGQVTPETWTHGSAEQRQTWFVNGLEGGTADACDTFNADI
ncbi:MAG TPA: neutral zinc metallopeptidase [Candidatus Limnocylindria bacterium]|nr:neutral zinc metallopeptidase [Candidatus Limnocylindria bacterium]